MRKALAKNVVRGLFATSGNCCAFPGCKERLVVDGLIFRGEICHIEAAERGGPRFNESQSDEERRSISNLILLCRNHHFDVDRQESRYTEKELKKIKAEHEGKFDGTLFNIDEAVLQQIADQVAEYWEEVERINERRRDPTIPVVAIDTNLDTWKLLLELEAGQHDLEEAVDIISASLTDEQRRSLFDTISLRFSNSTIMNAVHLRQLAVRIAELELRLDPTSGEKQDRLEQSRAKLKKVAETWYLVD